MQENWKDIKDFEGSYQVSDLGNVRSLPRRIVQQSNGSGYHVQSKPGKILKPQPNSKGYLRVHIGGKCRFVHRLVGETFLSNPDEKPVINHKDGNRLNNSLSNLEWVTRSENTQHAVRTGLLVTPCGEDAHNHILSEADVKWILQNYKKGCRTHGRKALARRFNVSHQNIKNIIDRKKWKHVQL